jgi:cytochrome c556
MLLARYLRSRINVLQAKSALMIRPAVVAGALLVVCGDRLVDASPSDNIAASKSRQDKMRDMGGAFKAINDELKKTNPDWDNIILPNAETVQGRSSYLLNWFPKGSGPEAGVKTYALPIIWQKSDDFTRLGKTAAAESTKLKIVASQKNTDAARAQFIVLGKACKACHDTYRSPDYEKDNDD